MLGTSQTSESNPLLVGDDMWHCNMFKVGWGHYRSLFICTTTTLLNYRQHGGEARKVLVAEGQPSLIPPPTHPHTIFSSEMVYSPPFLPCSTGKPARGVICPPGKPPATNRTLSMERTKHQMNSNESKVYNALQCTHNWTQLAMT